MLYRTEISCSLIFYRVDDVTQKESKKARPIPLNTVDLLKVASNQLHIGPHHTMQIAERLYVKHGSPTIVCYHFVMLLFSIFSDILLYAVLLDLGYTLIVGVSLIV